MVKYRAEMRGQGESWKENTSGPAYIKADIALPKEVRELVEELKKQGLVEVVGDEFSFAELFFTLHDMVPEFVGKGKLADLVELTDDELLERFIKYAFGKLVRVEFASDKYVSKLTKLFIRFVTHYVAEREWDERLVKGLRAEMARAIRLSRR